MASPARTREKGARHTRERILDAAEALFAESGFDAVSLRMITRAAGVELALANYHFGPKLDLFRAVVRRRAEALNEARMRALDALPADAPLEALIEAFTGPFLERSLNGGPGWKSYARVIAQTANSARWTRDVMATEFDPVAARFIERVATRYPRAERAEICWGFHFLLGAMTISFAETGRIDALSDGACRASDLAAIHARMVPFLAAGFRRLCEA
ncbi:MAG: TetR/AcrR family transcriptional regulator [Gammaproteobacteria bacterium]